ncbi:hypothetical protein ABT093_40530 [Kitasatospora sp. NPDC002551]|uniref:hypothetical protein n=1 Tax=Kitasatospora sp. NPDC002551 TaxID=3154539 RepID=UPI00332F59A3
MTTALTLDGSSRYHLDAACRALDGARLSTRGAVVEEDSDTLGQTPCFLCAATAGTAWYVTEQTIAELYEMIGPAKYHTSVDPGTGRLAVDGLTIPAHGDAPRAVARFGDTVRRHPDGGYRVHPAVGHASTP